VRGEKRRVESRRPGTQRCRRDKKRHITDKLRSACTSSDILETRWMMASALTLAPNSLIEGENDTEGAF
jgi:hypothetical protein